MMVFLGSLFGWSASCWCLFVGYVLCWVTYCEWWCGSSLESWSFVMDFGCFSVQDDGGMAGVCYENWLG